MKYYFLVMGAFSSVVIFVVLIVVFLHCPLVVPPQTPVQQPLYKISIPPPITKEIAASSSAPRVYLPPEDEYVQGTTTWLQRLTTDVPKLDGHAWTLYRNNEYNFEVSYPADWKRKVSRNGYQVWNAIFEHPPTDVVVLNILPDTADVYDTLESVDIFINGARWTLAIPNLPENEGATLMLHSLHNGLRFSFSAALNTQTGNKSATKMVKSFRFISH